MADPGRDREFYQEFISLAHLYHQQYQIDPYPIDAAEYRRRMRGMDFATKRAAYATQLASDAHAQEIVSRAAAALDAIPDTLPDPANPPIP